MHWQEYILALCLQTYVDKLNTVREEMGFNVNTHQNKRYGVQQMQK